MTALTARANERFEMDSTSTFRQMAGIVDDLVAAHPDLPAPHYAALHLAVGDISTIVDSTTAVQAWAHALDAARIRVYAGGAGMVQMSVDTIVDGVGVTITGSSPCTFSDVEHEHKTCIEQARAEVEACRHLNADEVRMSDCDHGCKVLKCRSCGVEETVHSSTYGCRQDSDILAERAPLVVTLAVSDVL